MAVYNIVTKLTDQVSPKLATMQKNISKTQNSIKSIQTGISKVGTFLAGGIGLAIAGFGLLSKAMDEQQQSDEKLRLSTKAYAEQMGMTAEQMDELFSTMQKNAGEIQDKGLFGDEAIQDAEALALQMGVSADSIRDLTQASADLTAKQKGAKATGEDLLANQKTLANAVASGSIPEAKKLGVSFTDLEKQQFEAGNETERMTMLMQKFKDQGIAGADEAIRNNTIGGHITGIKNNIGDCIQAIGQLVFSIGDAGVAGDIFKEIDNTVLWLKNTLSSCKSPLEALSKIFGEMKKNYPILTGIAVAVGAIAGTIGIVAGAIAIATGAMTAWTTAVGIFNAVIAANPAVVAILAVIAVIAIAYVYWDDLSEIATSAIDFISDGLNSFADTASQVWTNFTNWAGEAVDAVKGFFYDLWSNSVFGKVFNAIKNIAGGMSVKDAIAGAEPEPNATGTNYFAGGLAEVGEHGGEIINLPNGTQIIPNDISKKMTGGYTVSCPVTIQGNVIGNDDFINQIGNVITSRVQLAISNC